MDGIVRRVCLGIAVACLSVGWSRGAICGERAFGSCFVGIPRLVCMQYDPSLGLPEGEKSASRDSGVSLGYFNFGLVPSTLPWVGVWAGMLEIGRIQWQHLQVSALRAGFGLGYPEHGDARAMMRGGIFLGGIAGVGGRFRPWGQDSIAEWGFVAYPLGAMVIPLYEGALMGYSPVDMYLQLNVSSWRLLAGVVLPLVWGEGGVYNYLPIFLPYLGFGY